MQVDGVPFKILSAVERLRFTGPAVSFEALESYQGLDIAVSTQIYRKNRHLDANKDGIICFEGD